MCCWLYIHIHQTPSIHYIQIQNCPHWKQKPAIWIVPHEDPSSVVPILTTNCKPSTFHASCHPVYISKRINCILPCHLLPSSQINLSFIHLSKFLLWMSRPNNTGWKQTFSHHQYHNQRTHASIKENVQSTQTSMSKSIPTLETPQPSTTCHLSIMTFTGKRFSDQTGRLPLQSSLGNNYIFILHHTYTNAILTPPLKSRADHHLLAAFTSIKHYMLSKGFNIITL